MSCETQQVLRTRLRIAALMLFMGFSVFLIWQLIAWPVEQPKHVVLLWAHALVTLVLGVCSVSLCRRCVVSLSALRLRELLIFGLPAVFFLFFQYVSTTDSAAQHRMLPTSAHIWLTLIFTYSLFIPNTWQRAAAVLGTLAAAPVLMTILLSRFDPHCAAAINADFMSQMPMVLLLALSAVVSTIGIHTIGNLRREAFEAKRLGQYKLGQLLGAGGMGEVYLAEHQMMKRPCAIKVIRPERAGDPQVLARFEREVRATAKLSHWNNIHIFDYGRAEDGTFYYVMEYLPGMNLSELVKRYGPLPAERVIHLLRQTCDALAEAHAAGLIHRDIKPANIFAAQRGGVYDVAKLLDFGLAKPRTTPDSLELTQQGALTGSPLFMSPEQAAGDHEPDARSDIYALGAVGYYVLTGRPPFENTNLVKLLVAQAYESPVPPSELREEIPRDLERVILRCLAKAPADRYQSAEELAAALEDCQAADLWTRDLAAQWWRAPVKQAAGLPVA